MFSHIVVFWTDPAQPNAVDELIAGANQYQSHSRSAAISHWQNVAQPARRRGTKLSGGVEYDFSSKQAEQAYQIHPQHIEFVEKVFKRVCKKAVIYDFE